ncbi:MAG: ATP-dependent Clp protease ATP-binding subunit [Patescibacteria group bacterium]|nr:ATP-dependent Clp protease ATP-binding subunit [Patescibacteria group bacterium]
MDIPILHKLTKHLKKSLKTGASLAWQMRHKQINLEHLLYGLASSRGSISYDILKKINLKPENIKDHIDNTINPISEKALKNEDLKFSSPAKKVLEKAVLLANKYNHKYVGTEHLLISLIELNNKKIEEILIKNSISKKEIKKRISSILKSTSKFPDLTGFFEESEEKEKVPAAPKPSKTPALDFFATNLTDEKLQKNIDPVIGREKEIERLIHILSRRTKNNPILIGDPGVGKTAIIEGLAKKIIKDEVPEILKDKKILSLDLSLVIAGTVYRGEFESRVRQLIEEIKSDKRNILFIDEIHNIMGTGSASGSMDAANILKPALAKGQIRTIGATTMEEYKKNIESDPALERRFQSIIVRQSTPEETIKILEGIKDNFEKYHRVTITPKAIQAAVKLSSRYIQDKFLPDKAIDLIDEAASKIKVSVKPSPLQKKIRKKEKDLKKLIQEKAKAVQMENFKKAIYKKEEEKNLRASIHKLMEELAQKNKKMVGEIKEKDIAEIISKITGVPLSELVKSEKERLINMEKKIEKFIVGQDEAVNKVSDFIRRSRVGLSHPRRPLGSFIFLGPSGVGKTELAKVLTSIVFEDEEALIRIDMSEFSEKFNTSKLIGAPAGYVGYKESTKLTDQVKRKPYSVVLFDEIEKAHPDVFNLLLQIMEDGHLTDSVGKKINFKNTIIIMTSNIGLENLNQLADVGFESDKKDKEKAEKNYEKTKENILKDLKKEFRPEFLNRVDKIIVFKPLDKKAVEKIVNLQIQELEERLKDKGITLDLSSRAKKAMAKEAFSPDEGARAVRKLIQEKVENPLAQKILEGQVDISDKVAVKLKKGEIKLEKK